MQYTIRDIPAALDQALRHRAHQQRKSLNSVTLDALRRGAGLADNRPLCHDLDRLAGSWQEDAGFDEALRAQDQVDPALWR